MEHKNWDGFKTNKWQDEINVKDFILSNYQEYVGDDSFSLNGYNFEFLFFILNSISSPFIKTFVTLLQPFNK